MASKNIFVLGLTELHRGELEALPDADRYMVHSLLDVDTLVSASHIDIDGLLSAARAQLDAFGGEVDALIAHWDFPTSVIAPILAAERGLPGPSLQSVLRCEHKFWSRLEQRASAPECTPGFAVFDPTDEDALEHLGLEFPVFVKPVKSFSSQMSSIAEDAASFEAARQALRDGTNRMGSALSHVLERVQIPPELADVDGSFGMAEEVLHGMQYALEGSVHGGKVQIHGAFDMLMHPITNRVHRLIYPSAAPREIYEHMVDACERYLTHIGFDDACFNVEYRWDPETDRLQFIEFNTRISQSHSDLFAKVDGASNHAIAIDVALGQPPSMPREHGRFNIAELMHVTAESGGVVESVPSKQDLRTLCEELPETVVELLVEPGEPLGSETFDDGGHHDVAVVYHGAQDRAELDGQYERILERLNFEVRPMAPRTDGTPTER